MLVMVEDCARWVECFFLKTFSDEETSSALKKIFQCIGIPSAVIGDDMNFAAEMNEIIFDKFSVNL